MAKRQTKKQVDTTKKFVIVEKSKRQGKRRLRGCLPLALFACIGTVILVMIAPPSSKQQIATKTVAAILTSDRPATNEPTETPLEVAQDVTTESSETPVASIQAETTNPTSVPTDQPIKTETPDLAATERAVKNAAVLTQIANVVTPSPTITETIQPTPTNAPAQTFYVRASANARECPNADSTCAIAFTLSANEEVSVVGQVQGQAVSGNTLWYKLLYSGREVYVHSSLLSNTPPAPVQQQPVQQSIQQQPASQVEQAPANSSSGHTALCNDGSYSDSAHRRGTCSGHDGVAEWLKDVPP